MFQSRNSKIIVSILAIFIVALSIGIFWLILKGDSSLIKNVNVGDSIITPNADGDSDATQFSYQLTRNAIVSIYFENKEGQKFYFRKDKPRGVGEYEVLFSGVVNGYSLEGEQIEGEILSRLLQDGTYTWAITADDEKGNSDSVSGQLMIVDADTELPEIRNFTMDKHLFTPNQDGIDDRVQIQFFLPKEVAQTRVYVITSEGAELPIAELERGVEANSPGRHYFDYEAGVDNKATPPPDGSYPLVAIAVDDEGQKIRVEDSLTIQYGGVPRAEIVSPASGDTVSFSATAATLCDTIYFSMTVQNYGTTPIRTSGPAPGLVYDSDWNYNTLGWHTESGAWRAAIGYENEISNYPYRWAIGNQEDLEKIGDHYYLLPGQRAVVTGGIRLVGPFGERNPQPVWAGLIHEDVEISQFNNRVDPRQILVDIADIEESSPCENRDIPIFDAESSN